MNVLSAKKTLISNKGFSLVELMVVVAIIGILAAIAVPNVNKYMLKSRQGEAKTNLASVYTAERAFFTEHTTYLTDLSAIGFKPEGQIRFNVGFTSNTRDCTTAGVNTTVACDAVPHLVASGAVKTGTSGNALCAGSCSPYQVASIPDIPAGAVAAQNTFNSSAIAAFGTYGGSGNDVWGINESKVISNSTSGL